LPDLSLAIAVKGPWDASALVQALSAAGAITPRIDVHIACDRAPEITFEGIDFIVREGLSLFQMWGLAVTTCQAPYIAILHGHAPPAPDWAKEMLAALGPNRQLCGPIEPGYPPSDPRITGYLVEYCQFHRPISAGLREVPGNNMVLARWMLPSAGILERDGFSKTSMIAAGALQPEWVNDALVVHNRPFALLQFCHRRFFHGRAYGAARLAEPSAIPRFALIAATALLPLIRLTRIAKQGWRHPTMRLALLRRLPAILLAETCWSAGEFAGYVTARPGDVTLLD
jgi:hypothetical protein